MNILITGSSQGLGRELALQYAAQGTRLFLCARNLQALRQTAQACKKAGCSDIRIQRCDLNSTVSVRSACRTALRHFGHIDILINNAAVHSFAEVETLNEYQLLATLNTNLAGPIRFIQNLLPSMHARRSGKIVNITSTIGLRAIPFGSAYCASKAAFMRVTESLRDELRGSGIQVIHVIPGVIRTNLRRNALRDPALQPDTEKLPFSWSVEKTARKIIKGTAAGQRDIFCAAWPVWLFFRVITPLAPGLVDRFLSRNVIVNRS